ncbi:ABC transporter ATP-binding protein [Paraglaciecola sp. 2405UD69-4]|uniref:ABC transporter ATP-binding protein n=1 Tax=Paraglaciecola sp. 2405UD69-4 TaxID=3391836 RepID=UPI0039C8EA75
MIGIQVQNVCYQYKGNKEPALKDISFTIDSGMCVGLIGPNGAGKSTLLSILSGLLTPTSGSIAFTEHQASLHNQKLFIKKHIALVPQEYAFYFPLSVLQNLEYFASLCGFNSAQQQNAIHRVVSECQLQSVLKQKSKSLSGGYKRRLNLAIALLKDPKVLYLDEPTVGVDPVSRKAILALIDSLKKQQKTIVFTSHMLSEIQEHCDATYMIKAGKTFEFANQDNKHLLKLVFAQPLAASFKDKIKQLEQWEFPKDDTLECQLQTDKALWEVMQLAQQMNITIRSIQYGPNTLTEYYLKLMEHHDTAKP